MLSYDLLKFLASLSSTPSASTHEPTGDQTLPHGMVLASLRSERIAAERFLQPGQENKVPLLLAVVTEAEVEIRYTGLNFMPRELVEGSEESWKQPDPVGTRVSDHVMVAEDDCMATRTVVPRKVFFEVQE
ncbi:hypothetical protein L249_3761 [Ophiocordyceps polyrhachis-furcata BCC 54312]|uniref:Uncharacterized protein n=1 Tax=Ophiocordyceps polyrhachis-furcata BCC 54312 TaxID=1330021 RepID=A0A367L4K8_9HYPO|nr:hypothetical protein L249_3761 [Ophiocordyceps polyrhachis-furcata BCC 54312]